MVAIGISVFSILLAMLLLPQKYYRFIFIIICLLLSIVAYNWEPPVGMDLYRHYTLIQNFRTEGWKGGLLFSPYTNNQPIVNYIFYAVSLLPVKYNGILPAIGTFIGYYLFFEVIFEISIEEKIDKISIIIATIFFVSTYKYLYLVSSIRNFVAFSILFYFLYLDLVKHKSVRLCFLVYFLLGFWHYISFLILLFRVILVFYQKYAKPVIAILIIFWKEEQILLFAILNKLSFFPIFSFLKGKTSFYIEREIINYKDMVVPIVIFLTITLVLLYYIYESKNKKEIKNQITSEYINYVFLIVCFTVGAVTSVDLFVRFVNFMVLLIGPIIINLIKKNSDIKKDNIFLIRSIILLSSFFCLTILLKSEYLPIFT